MKQEEVIRKWNNEGRKAKTSRKRKNKERWKSRMCKRKEGEEEEATKNK